MVTEIPWGDGSGDLIYLTYSASEGDQTVLVSSDPNAGAARTQNITFVSTVGNISRTLTVIQEAGATDLVSITWNDVCITYNDTAIAYPYEKPKPVFYNYLYFTRPAYIATDYYLPNLPSFMVSLGMETTRAGMQRIIRAGSGNDLIAIQYTSNTANDSSGRRFGIYYGTSTIATVRYLAWSTDTYTFWITYSRWGIGNTVYTYTKGTGVPTEPLMFGGDTNSYTGRMGTVYVYDSTTQNVTSLAGLSSYTPVATFRPCTYNGEAGMWHVEEGKFYGNSADSGSLAASDT